MPHNYYFYVSGLPGLSFEEGKKAVTYREWREEACAHLEPGDVRLLQLMGMPFDHANLMALLEKRERPWDGRANFSREELERELKNPDRLPAYVTEFLHAFHEGRPFHPDLAWEDQLTWQYHDFVLGAGNAALAAWSAFDLHLRGLLAAFAARAGHPHLGKEAARVLQGAMANHDEVTDRLLRSNAPDLGLSLLFPAVNAVLALPAGDRFESERRLDALRWGFLDEMAVKQPFGVEAVLAHAGRLAILERWAALTPELGRARLEGFLTEAAAALRA